jgi:hypothetical protein
VSDENWFFNGKQTHHSSLITHHSNKMLSEAEKQTVVAAIKEAELQTSGEIKVHFEELCPEPDPVERAEP